MAITPPMKPNPPQIPGWIKKIFQLVLYLVGWRVDGEVPDVPKALLVVAPHTSNWDFFYMLACLWGSGLRAKWMAKVSLFRGPAGPLMRWLGGIAVDRSEPHNVVRHTAKAFSEQDKLMIGVLPEGTRSKRDYWKSGFYYIAQTAQVPLFLTYVDYERKTGFLGPLLTPSGDIEADMAVIREFYSGVKGKYPEKFGPVRVKIRQKKDEVHDGKVDQEKSHRG